MNSLVRTLFKFSDIRSQAIFKSFVTAIQMNEKCKDK